MIQRALVVLIVLFPVSEIALAFVKRSHGGSALSRDRGSMRLLWACIILGMVVAMAAQWVPSMRLPLARRTAAAVALALLVSGLVIRWAAIVTLGRLFTVDVAIHEDHTVVETGLYRFVRHPSYSGLLVAFLGVGVFFFNWLSILGLMIPVVLGVLNRVETEEKALIDSLGNAYSAYCARTRRFIPGLW